MQAIAFATAGTSTTPAASPRPRSPTALLAVGHVGTMAEYLLNTVTHLEAAGIHDRRLWRMQALVAERLERLPAFRAS